MSLEENPAKKFKLATESEKQGEGEGGGGGGECEPLPQSFPLVSKPGFKFSTSRQFKMFDDGIVQEVCPPDSYDQGRLHISLPPIVQKYFDQSKYTNCPRVVDLQFTGQEITDEERLNYYKWITSTRNFANTLSIKEMKAIEIYQGVKYFSFIDETQLNVLPANAMRTHHMQNFLRSNRKGEYRGSTQIAQYVRLLQGVIERAPKSLAPMVVWRGIKPQYCGQNYGIATNKMPKKFTSPDFYSFSTSFGKAFFFTGDLPNLMKVVIRPQDRAQYLLISAFNDSEREVVFQPYTDFTLTNIIPLSEYQKKTLMSREFDYYLSEKSRLRIQNTLVFEYEAVFISPSANAEGASAEGASAEGGGAASAVSS